MKIGGIIGGTILLSLATVVIGLANNVSAAAQVCTWTGGGGDYKVGTATNWSGCAGSVPQSGDILKFDTWVGPVNGSTSNSVALTNDLASTAFGGVVVDGPTTNGNLYQMDTLTFAHAATFQIVKQGSGESLRLNLTNATGLGDITLDGAGANKISASNITIMNNAWSYNITAKDVRVASGSELVGSIDQDGVFSYKNTENIIIENGAKLYICGSSGYATISSNLTLGGGSGPAPEIRFERCMGGVGGAEVPSAGAVFTGSIVLQSDASIESTNKRMVMDGLLVPNGHKLTMNASSTSMVMGRGTIGDINLVSGSIIAPGASPGCLSTGSISWVEGAVYSFDLGGRSVCSEYDQIKVSGTVTLGNGTIDIVKYGGFQPSVGDVFTVIDNDGSDAVSGTFKDLAEGAIFVRNGTTFRISYLGGDGNDVTLTAMNIPSVPNTGFMRLGTSPVMIGTGMILALARLVFMRVKKSRG